MIPDINQRQSYSAWMALNFKFCHSNLIPPIGKSGSAMVVLNLIIKDWKHPTYNVYSLNYCIFTFEPNRRFTLYVLIFPVQGYEKESFSNHPDQRVDFLNDRITWFSPLNQEVNWKVYVRSSVWIADLLTKSIRSSKWK